MNTRKSNYPINQIFLDRWSPRAFSGEKITQEELLTLFEAARWAPSSYNNQPWRMIYAHRDTPAWQKLFDLMVPFNQSWAKNAGVLIVFVSKKIFDYNGKPARTHSFDTGAAWMSLALQCRFMGLFAHGMEGFDYDKAIKDLNVPDDCQVEAMCALGRLGKKELLPPDLQAREEPSGRRPLAEIAFEGMLKK